MARDNEERLRAAWRACTTRPGQLVAGLSISAPADRLDEGLAAQAAGDAPGDFATALAIRRVRATALNGPKKS